MFLSELASKIAQAGYGPDIINEVYDLVFQAFPSVQANIYSQPMSTAQEDSWLPPEFVEVLIAELNLNIESSPEIPTFSLGGKKPPKFPVVSDPVDRRKLVGKALELVPGVNELSFSSPAGREAYKKKIRGMKEIFKTQNLSIGTSPWNRKVGFIENFSLPAGNHFRGGTCPGASKLCEKICYAKKGPGAQFQEWRYFINWAFIELWPDRFVDIMCRIPLAPVMRVHVGGDYYSQKYIRMWMKIIKAQQDRVRFYSYTRSWQNGNGKIAKSFIQPLRDLAALPNMRLVLSADAETGIPPSKLIPKSIRAWLATNNLDIPETPLELIFRDPGGMAQEVINAFPKGATSQRTGSPVCPVERNPKYIKADGQITCQDCAWCWGGAYQAYGRRKDDLSRFDLWARADLNRRTKAMFGQFVPWGKPAPRMKGIDEVPCSCGSETPCLDCGYCVYCRCRCKR